MEIQSLRNRPSNNEVKKHKVAKEKTIDETILRNILLCRLERSSKRLNIELKYFIKEKCYAQIAESISSLESEAIRNLYLKIFGEPLP